MNGAIHQPRLRSLEKEKEINKNSRHDQKQRVVGFYFMKRNLWSYKKKLFFSLLFFFFISDQRKFYLQIHIMCMHVYERGILSGSWINIISYIHQAVCVFHHNIVKLNLVFKMGKSIGHSVRM